MWFNKKAHSAIKYIKIQGLKKDVEKHFFELEWEKLEDTNFEWRLIKITPSEYDYEGVMRQTVKMLFIDSIQEYYQLDISFNWLSRWLLNTLLWYIDKIKVKKWKIDLELSLYINKEWYKSMWIKINSERWDWRYLIEEQRKMIETIVKKNGTKENDYFEFDTKLRDSIGEIQDFITINDFIEEKTNQQDNKEISIEDIPF